MRRQGYLHLETDTEVRIRAGRAVGHPVNFGCCPVAFGAYDVDELVTRHGTPRKIVEVIE